ncbi:MAG: molybdenum cofactor biosynthesis protein MoaE [Flavobacteriales bacterium]|jgi:molybdopterin synthase catalytic subunit|nr:molybdenum cofactor biosynthesis protein MoaE [Flavobacteriales bacterium]MCB0758849.1 molybdenum cofactor biosynthesis protein MoaE [Flavobacteriales bacterium]
MKTIKTRNIFVQGAITPERIATSIAHHQDKTGIGAHDIFLGQVRADTIGTSTVAAIEYSAHEEMANAVMAGIREEAFSRFDLTCMHVYHSLGAVPAGGLCLFVFVSSPHRQAAFDACRYMVEQIKERLPIFGKELFAEGGHQWKENQ